MAARYLCRSCGLRCGFRCSFRGCWQVSRKTLLYCQLGRLTLLDLQHGVQDECAVYQISITRPSWYMFQHLWLTPTTLGALIPDIAYTS